MDQFVDPIDAGKKLSAILGEFHKSESTYVVGIATGGMPVAAEVARALVLPLDILLIKRLLVTGDPLQTKCAIDVGGTLYLDDEIEVPDVPASGAEHALADRLSELTRHREICRGSLPPVDFSGRHVLLVDNGIRTGSTILAAIRALRSIAVSNITVAVPLTGLGAKSLIESHTDRLISLSWPDRLGHVGLGYKALVRPSNHEMNELLMALNPVNLIAG